MQLFSARRGSASLTFFSVLTEFELSKPVATTAHSPRDVSEARPLRASFAGLSTWNPFACHKIIDQFVPFH